MKTGISIASSGKTMADGDVQYDSTNNRLQVNVKEVDKHLDILTRSGGTSWVVPESSTSTENLLVIPHKMPFTPDFLIYFLCTDAPVLSADKVGSYYPDGFYMDNRDAIYGVSDETNFYIVHQTENPLIGSTYTSEAGSFTFRIKYMILNTHTTKIDDWV